MWWIVLLAVIAFDLAIFAIVMTVARRSVARARARRGMFGFIAGDSAATGIWAAGADSGSSDGGHGGHGGHSGCGGGNSGCGGGSSCGGGGCGGGGCGGGGC